MFLALSDTTMVPITMSHILMNSRPGAEQIYDMNENDNLTPCQQQKQI